MTKAKEDQLPLGFDDHYLIQGLRDQVEELQGALLRATEALSGLDIPVSYFCHDKVDASSRPVCSSIKGRIGSVFQNLDDLHTQSKEMTRILDQLQQKEVKLS